MSAPQTPDTFFATQLHGLYKAAGSPDLATLNRQARGQDPPLELSDSTLSDWFTGKSIPAKEKEFRFLVNFLEGRAAARKDPKHVKRDADGWWRLRDAARRARRHQNDPTNGGSGIAASGVDAPSLLAAGSPYKAQVGEIAPPELFDREAELEELARFCLDEQDGPYVWWQAGPWAGKSALFSTFVLRPPEAVRSRVRVAAFFITARFAAQDTRQAFITVVGEQLVALTGKRVPAESNESSREAWLLNLLAEAAEACRNRGTRLVLLVDGLDEDRGMTTGRYARSIAGLLPGQPQAGMRVIVAGRPNPPIPDDVDGWHPLRDPGIIRPLTDSPHARALQDLGKRELKRLLTGSELEQNLLGLLTAARSGLSADDLHEITEVELIYVEEVLHTAAGRTFTRGFRQWADADGPPVYLLGHEELDAAARRYLGGTRLTGYRDRLHAWARRYRHPDRGLPWPPNTPEYLLLGYPRMLATSGELSRLVDLVTDPDRHDRMRYLSGGDDAALAEITACQDLVLDEPVPDLEAMLRLCIRRSNLVDRNRNIPADLPAIWAKLGKTTRAAALARSITDPYRQAKALAAVTTAGDPDRARQLAEQAEVVARSITNQLQLAQALAAVARAVAATDPAYARQLAAHAETASRSITIPSSQAEALAAVARAVAATDPAHAVAVAHSISDPNAQAQVLAAVARAVAATDPTHAEAMARSITDPAWRATALAPAMAAVARASAAADPAYARQLATDAVAVTRSITWPDLQAEVLALVARAVAATDPAHAVALAHSISNSNAQVEALAAVVEAVAATDSAYARRLAAEAVTVARSITWPDWQVEALAAVVEAVAAADPAYARQLAAHAEAVARSIIVRYQQAQALAAVAQAVAATDSAYARQLATDAETASRSITAPDKQVLAAVVQVTAATDPVYAVAVAHSITDGYEQAQALVTVARAVAAIDPKYAVTVARSTTDEYAQAHALAAVVQVVTATDPAYARQLATDAEAASRSITGLDPRTQPQALAAVARAIAAADPAYARRLATDAVTMARSITDPDLQAQALAAVVQAVTTTDPTHARQLVTDAVAVARSITYPDLQAQALAAVARAIAATDPAYASRLAADAETAASSIPLPDFQLKALAVVTRAVADTDPAYARRLATQAAAVARSITDPDAKDLAAVAQAVGAADPVYARQLATDAEAAARSITNPYLQARALAAVAQAVASTDPSLAGRLLGGLLVTASWEVSLPVLAEYWPQVVRVCADALSGNERSRDTPTGTDTDPDHRRPGGQ